MQEEKIFEILKNAGCILLEKSPHIAMNGIKFLIEQNGPKEAFSILCTECGVKSDNKCPGKQKEINRILETVMS